MVKLYGKNRSELNNLSFTSKRRYVNIETSFNAKTLELVSNALKFRTTMKSLNAHLLYNTAKLDNGQ